MRSTLRYIFCIISCLMLAATVSAQQPKTSPDTSKLDPPKTFVEKMQAFAKQSAKSSAEDFEADKAAIAQNKIFEEIKKNIQKSKTYLNSFTDTSSTTSLSTIEKDFKIAGDGVLSSKGTAQTFRNLTATSKILTELLAKATARKTVLDLRHEQLNTYRYKIDSLVSSPDLFKFPTDSTILLKYIQQISVVALEVSPVDSLLKKYTLDNQAQLNKTNLLVFKLQTSLEEIANYQIEMARNTFRREFANLWEPSSYNRAFGEILNQALSKGMLTLLFYLENNTGKIIILLLLISIAFLYLNSLKSIYKERALLVSDLEGQLVLRYPLLSAILLVLNIGQFLFLSPPFILSVIFWTISCISLSILFYKFITTYWMSVWLLMVALFLISAADNLILQASRAERWLMLIISLIGAIMGLFIVLNGKKQELREKLILVSIGFMAFLEFASVIANTFGRYNLAKTLMISGYLNVVVAILFLWTLRLINEGLFLAFSVYTRQDKKLFYLNFDKVGKKAPAVFYMLLILGWLILFARNFAGFDNVAVPLREFFTQQRTLGDYTFSINGLALFFVIMAISVATSKVVSFFASDRHLSADREDKKSNRGIGSWLLLVRITILSIGLFLAIAAAGIPLDRITIILGALGVGIGFGLQTMVNNLVSGLIIAFEKPVNVGDIVDIDGQEGTMKSVGFRSSVITTWDGADVVMPNGDLLNSHLINWTLGGNRRRVSIAMGIAYDANLDTIKEILLKVLDAEERILKKPGPFVQYEQFGNSVIEVKIYFWTRDFKEASTIKSDIIIEVAKLFKKEHIVINYAKQDIYVHTINDEQQPKPEKPH